MPFSLEKYIIFEKRNKMNHFVNELIKAEFIIIEEETLGLSISIKFYKDGSNFHLLYDLSEYIIEFVVYSNDNMFDLQEILFNNKRISIWNIDLMGLTNFHKNN